MSLYYNLLDEQIRILKEKGYEEKQTRSPDKEGWLFTQLSRGLSDSLQQSWREGEAVTFQIRTTGFFNNDLDIVNFNFQYVFDYEKSDLRLTQLEISSQGIGRTIELSSAAQLPHSSAGLRLIREQNHLNRKRFNNYRPVYSGKCSEVAHTPTETGRKIKR